MRTDLQARGEYWIKRLADEYGLHVAAGAWRFEYRQLGAVYGRTHERPRLVQIHVGLATLDVALLDEMLVHELIHATGVYDHGPTFKRRYARVYPWAKPGPVTEFDPGTPRRVLWQRIKRELPLAGRS